MALVPRKEPHVVLVRQPQFCVCAWVMPGALEAKVLCALGLGQTLEICPGKALPHQCSLLHQSVFWAWQEPAESKLGWASPGTGQMRQTIPTPPSTRASSLLFWRLSCPTAGSAGLSPQLSDCSQEPRWGSSCAIPPPPSPSPTPPPPMPLLQEGALASFLGGGGDWLSDGAIVAEALVCQVFPPANKLNNNPPSCCPALSVHPQCLDVLPASTMVMSPVGCCLMQSAPCPASHPGGSLLPRQGAKSNSLLLTLAPLFTRSL